MKVAAPTVDWEKWKFLVETREGWAICAVSVAFFFCCCESSLEAASSRYKWLYPNIVSVSYLEFVGAKALEVPNL